MLKFWACIYLVSYFVIRIFNLILILCFRFSRLFLDDRHEMPVADIGVDILVDNADVLVVNKPSSMPVHPCGRYRHNSLIYILAKEYGYVNLRGKHGLTIYTSKSYLLTILLRIVASVEYGILQHILAMVV